MSSRNGTGACGHAGEGEVAARTPVQSGALTGGWKRAAVAYGMPVARTTSPSRHPVTGPQGGLKTGSALMNQQFHTILTRGWQRKVAALNSNAGPRPGPYGRRVPRVPDEDALVRVRNETLDGGFE